MARKYRRYKKRNDDNLGSAVGIIVLIGGLAAWQTQKDNHSFLLFTGIGVGLLLLAVVSLAIWKYRKDKRKLRGLDTAQIDNMDHLDFEDYVAELLRSRGFRGVHTTEKYDYGVDVVAEKDGVRWGVQVKHYKNLVKAEAVRQVVTALVRYKCDRGMVVTNSTFSRPARELAADNNCVLIDRDALYEWVVDFQNSRVFD